MISRILCSGFLASMAFAVFFAAPVAPQTTTAYFLVANPTLYPSGQGDSYVLPLSDPGDIADARNLIASGTFKIVSANITTGADGINRDVLAPDEPEWRWHVIEFLNFADLAAEICDGSPTFTADQVRHWNDGDVGMICYWSYTVVAELPAPSPVLPMTWGELKTWFVFYGR